jgi:RNA polymerase sigma factor (sigma-70 family)
MAIGALGALGRQLERVFTNGPVAGLTEGQLLDRFVSHRDDAAFEALVARHGPMVLTVCRRYLSDPNDVDDAYQATFLVLVRRAGSLRRSDLLGNWLYGVAYRVALRARAVATRRRAAEGVEHLAAAGSVTPADPDTGVCLHEELRRLPEKYRAPVVLCYLEGLTHEEAADRLRWPVGTVKGRLSRARDLLRSRLTRRGLTLATAASALDLLARDAPAALPERLVGPTVRAAAQVAAGTATATAGGLVSAQAVALSQGVLHAMSLSQLKSAAATFAVAATMVTGVGAFAYQEIGKPDPGPPDRPKSAAPTEKAKFAAGAPFFKRATIAGSSSLDQDAERIFQSLLDQGETATPWRLDRVAHWSRAICEAETYLTENQADKVVAYQAHADRMRRLHEMTQHLTDKDQPKKADVARGYREEAERDLLNARNGNSSSSREDAPKSSPPQSPRQPKGEEDDSADAPVGTKRFDRLDFRMVARAAGLPGDMAAPGGTGPGGRATGPANPGAAGGGAVMGLQRSPFWTRLDIAALAAEFQANDTNPKSRYVLKKLDEPISMNFVNETPLEDVLKYLKSATSGPNDSGLPIYLDPAGLQEAEKTTTSTVSLDLEGVPLKTTLRLLLKQLGLAYCVKDGILMISSPNIIRQELLESVVSGSAAGK